MATFGVTAHVTEAPERIVFSYFHPLSHARMSPPVPSPRPPLRVSGAAVLRFGMVEGDAIAEGRRVTYDPQGSEHYAAFCANGSRAGELAIVLNEGEAARATGLEGADAAKALLDRERAAIVVVKGGAKGALVAVPGEATSVVPAYRSERVFKIGSGDVFSAIFAHAWAERGMDATSAAAAASAETARYVASMSLPVPMLEPPDPEVALPAWGDIGTLYLAGPFFDVAQLWLIEELRGLLIEAGAKVFSPFHQVGMGLPPAEVARADLEGLRAADAVLAILDGEDPGTIFEVGYAAALGKPVVALAERVPEANLTMLALPGIEIVPDVATAVYKAVWATMR